MQDPLTVLIELLYTTTDFGKFYLEPQPSVTRLRRNPIIVRFTLSTAPLLDGQQYGVVNCLQAHPLVTQHSRRTQHINSRQMNWVNRALSEIRQLIIDNFNELVKKNSTDALQMNGMWVVPILIYNCMSRPKINKNPYLIQPIGCK